MDLSLLLVLFAATAVVVHVARYWRPLAFVASVAATGVLTWAVANASSAPVDLLGITFALQPLARDYLLVAMAVSGVLAIATSLANVRRTLGFMFWSWTAWLVALTVSDFVVGVFAWATGLAALVIAMEPRRLQRVGGAAYFLVLIVVATALLLIGHRFIQLYPLTPDQVSLVDSSLLFFTWGLGLLLGIAPFMVWLGPMADETPPPIIAVLLGLGQPVGLWLLYGLIGQYPRLLEQSPLLPILTFGGAAAILVGGALCALERRSGRLMSFAALFALGFILLDLSRGTLEGTAYGVIESFARVGGLALVAISLTVGRNVEHRFVRYLAVLAFILGVLDLTGLGPGISLATRWNLLLELEATDLRLFYATMLATIGVLAGAARFVQLWLVEIAAPPLPKEPAPAPLDGPRSIRARLRATLVRGFIAFGHRLPHPVRRAGGAVQNNWRALVGALLLLAGSSFMFWYSWTPNFWLQRALDTVTQLAFIR